MHGRYDPIEMPVRLLEESAKTCILDITNSCSWDTHAVCHLYQLATISQKVYFCPDAQSVLYPTTKVNSSQNLTKPSAYKAIQRMDNTSSRGAIRNMSPHIIKVKD
ncbi:hypothetical protein FRC02_007666 [Tulasnella sp. 418]|nr:hypothetical protein FRC02_007666 [Tulasnella sp. 418]